MEDLSTLGGAQAWLDRHRATLSGSRARGDWTPESDWDYYIPDRMVGVLKRELIRQGVTWESPFIGSITWQPEDIQVEVSILFPRRYPFQHEEVRS